jgi:hypothetical protein
VVGCDVGASVGPAVGVPLGAAEGAAVGDTLLQSLELMLLLCPAAQEMGWISCTLQ